MPELRLVVVLVVALIGVPTLLAVASWDIVFVIGLALVLVGMGVGVPAGVVYHAKLWRALAPRGALGRTWWLRPTAFHGALEAGERPGVMRWFYIGAVSWVLAVAGCVIAALGAVRGQ
jgi:hypothetical protein